MFEQLMSIDKTSALSKMKLEKALPEQISPFVVASVKVNFPMNGSVISRTRQRRLAFFYEINHVFTRRPNYSFWRGINVATKIGNVVKSEGVYVAGSTKTESNRRKVLFIETNQNRVPWKGMDCCVELYSLEIRIRSTSFLNLPRYPLFRNL